MKHALLLLVMALSLSATGQTLIWESAPNARPSNQAFLDIFYTSEALTDDFDNDGIADVVLSAIYRDSLFFQINLPDDLLRFHANHPSLTPSTAFLGYVKIPDLPGESVQDTNPLLFGTQAGERIIGILIASESDTSGEFDFQPLDWVDNYRFLSVNDVNDDGVADFLIFNQDKRTLQLWNF